MSAIDKALSYDACEPTPARLPMLGLLALACGAFITVLTECIVAGLLPAMSRDLGLSEALVGQLTTVYALGSLLTAIPMVKLTSHFPRRPLLLAAILGFALVNSVMAWTDAYALMLVSRFLGGVAAAEGFARAEREVGELADAQRDRAPVEIERHENLLTKHTFGRLAIRLADRCGDRRAAGG